MSISLKNVLIIPFVLQVLGTTALVGYLSYRSGQRAIEDLAQQLMAEVGDRTQLFLAQTLSVPHQVNQLNADAIATGYFPDLDTQNPIPVEQFFLRQIEHFPAVSSVTLGTNRGGMVGAGQSWKTGQRFLFSTENLAAGNYFVYVPDTEGNRTQQQLVASDFDARTRPWYQTPMQVNQATWSPIYQFISPENQPFSGISAGLPLRRPNGEIEGVLATDITLDQITTFLDSLEISPSSEVFILERSGNLVATSSGDPVFFLPETAQTAQRVAAAESSNPLIRSTVQAIAEQAGDFETVETTQFSFWAEIPSSAGEAETAGNLLGNQSRYFVDVLSYQDRYGLDWLMVIVVPASDFMGKIYANVRRTIGLTIATLIGAIALGIWTTRRIARPISALNRAIQAIAAGDLFPKTQPTRIKEVESLRQAFYQMAEDLSDSSQTLQESEQKFMTLMDQLPIGVGVFDPRGNVLWSNQAAQQIFGQKPVETDISSLSSTYQAYRAGTDDLYPTAELPAVRSLQGEVVHVHDMEVVPHEASAYSGQRIPLEVRSAPVYSAEGKIIYAITVFQDISERKQTEQLLTVFHESTDAMFLVDPNTTLTVECNATAVKMFEAIQADQLIGIEGEVLQKRPFTPQERAQIQRTLEEQGFHTLEAEYVTLQGKSFWGEFSIKQIQIGGRAFSLVRVIDITTRKAAELALRESETRFQAISDTSPAIIYCVVRRVDGSFYFEHISRAIETIQEASAEAILKDASVLFDGLHPDDRTRYQAACHHSQKTMEPFQCEWRTITSSGKIKWLQGVSCPLRRGNGEIAWYGTAIDITERKQAELAFQQATRQLKALSENAPAIISLFNLEGRYLQVNQAFVDLVGRPADAIIGKTFADLFSEEMAALFRARLQRLVDTGQPLTVDDEIELDGAIKTFQSILFPVPVTHEEMPTFWGIALDVSDRKAAERELQRLNVQLEELAAHDSLTQLANRRQWQTTLDQEWQRHKRDRRPLTLIMLDIDHFKAYNDCLGHPAGDECLIRVAASLQSSVNRPGDLVARYGGEEFCILLPETDEQGAVAVANRIQRELYAMNLHHPKSSVSDRLTASLGIVVVKDFETSRPLEAIAEADAALYTAKRTRNSYSIRQLARPL